MRKEVVAARGQLSIAVARTLSERWDGDARWVSSFEN